MKILINGLNYFPELTGIGKYTGELAEWLAARGHEVRVVTAPPYYPEWRVGAGFAARRYGSEMRNGVKVWRCPLYVPALPTGAKRIVHLASFALSSLPIILGLFIWRPDLVLVIEPPFFCAPAAWLVACLTGAEAWLHIQDFELDAAFELGLLQSASLRKLANAFERWWLRRFDRVSTISSRMLERLCQKGVEKTRQVFFPNWVDTDDIYPLERPSIFRQEIGIVEQQIVALYAGNMGQKQGLDIIVEAAKRLREKENICFVLCGQGAAYQHLRDLARGMKTIYWLPLQPVERLNELLNLADIHLLPQRADAADLVMPSKLTGMLASGRPVLATASAGTQVAEVVNDAGVVVPPGDSEKFSLALQELAEDAEMRKRLGAAARRYAVKHLKKEVVLGDFEQEVLKLL